MLTQKGEASYTFIHSSIDCMKLGGLLPDFPFRIASPFIIPFNMQYTVFTEKEMLKQDKELIELHKRCCKTYLVQHSLKHAKIKKFFIIYDWYITTDNIRCYFFRPINLFVQALVLNQLTQLSDYVNPNKNAKKRKRRTNRV